MAIRTHDFLTDEQRKQRNKQTSDYTANRQKGLQDLVRLSLERTGRIPIDIFDAKARQFGFDLRAGTAGATPTRAETPISNVVQGGGKGLEEVVRNAAIASGNLGGITATHIPQLGLGATNIVMSDFGIPPMEIGRGSLGGFTQRVDIAPGRSAFVYGRADDFRAAQYLLQKQQAALKKQLGKKGKQIEKKTGKSLISLYLAQQGQK